MVSIFVSVSLYLVRRFIPRAHALETLNIRLPDTTFSIYRCPPKPVLW
jgi:hypothetical protein